MPDTTMQAKPIVADKFWIVENNGERVGTLRKKENNKFILSSTTGNSCYSDKSELVKAFGKQFFTAECVQSTELPSTGEIHGYPTNCYPHAATYDVQQKLPLFTKTPNSKSYFCAGYYAVRFEKGWVRSFCPKLITLERNEYKGPFRTELEMRQVLAHAKSI